jgi:hypothetical protein
MLLIHQVKMTNPEKEPSKSEKRSLAGDKKDKKKKFFPKCPPPKAKKAEIEKNNDETVRY